MILFGTFCPFLSPPFEKAENGQKVPKGLTQPKIFYGPADFTRQATFLYHPLPQLL